MVAYNLCSFTTIPCGRLGGCKNKKMKLMLYSTLVEIEVKVGIELGNDKNVLENMNKYFLYLSTVINVADTIFVIIYPPPHIHFFFL